MCELGAVRWLLAVHSLDTLSLEVLDDLIVNVVDLVLAQDWDQVFLDRVDVGPVDFLPVAVRVVFLQFSKNDLGYIFEVARDGREVVDLADLCLDVEALGDLYGLFEVSLTCCDTLPHTVDTEATLPNGAAFTPCDQQFFVDYAVRRCFFGGHFSTV